MHEKISGKITFAVHNKILRRREKMEECYAAVADKLTVFRRRQLIVDIGSWTLDLMPIEDMIRMRETVLRRRWVDYMHENN